MVKQLETTNMLLTTSMQELLVIPQMLTLLAMMVTPSMEMSLVEVLVYSRMLQANGILLQELYMAIPLWTSLAVIFWPVSMAVMSWLTWMVSVPSTLAVLQPSVYLVPWLRLPLTPWLVTSLEVVRVTSVHNSTLGLTSTKLKSMWLAVGFMVLCSAEVKMDTCWVT